MFYEDLSKHIRSDSVEYDVLAKITQHPLRPKPIREIDQIFMLPGSQLNQAKLISSYLRNREVVFVGDGDCMSLVIGMLAKERVIDRPTYMHVLDFDERIVKFVRQASEQFGFSEYIEAHLYNVRHPVPDGLKQRSDLFYTNPPYGSKNRGMSGIVFLARCMELCKPVQSHGVAILPYRHHEPWSRDAMFEIQRFIIQQGYVVAEMLQEMHAYHLDDRPRLHSGTVVMDRVERKDPPFVGRELSENELCKFYGESQPRVPERVDLNGELMYA